MRQLREAIRQKRIKLWKNQSWTLHHGSEPDHTAILVCEYLNKNKTVIMLQPPFSADLCPADFFLFPKLKTLMKLRRSATIEKIKEKSKQKVLAIPKRAFQKFVALVTANQIACLKSLYPVYYGSLPCL